MRNQFTRRSFLKVCGSFAALVSAHAPSLAKQSGPLKHYKRVALVDADQNPLELDQIRVGECYVFHYPFVSTPCFLIDLGSEVKGGEQLQTEDGQSYRWQGGTGPNRSIVAFSAICSHKMSHPSRQISFINYRHKETEFVNSNSQQREREQIIYCCSEKSVYDPARGARVLGGPAPQPLASIAMEYDSQTGRLYATGTYGGEMFDKFLTDFARRLSLEYKTTDIDKPVVQTTTVLPMEEFCRNQILC